MTEEEKMQGQEEEAVQEGAETKIPVEDAEETTEETAETAETENTEETEETAEEADEAAETADAGTKEKKGFFGRGRREDKEKAALQEKVDALEDRVKRQMAEFDNYRKRTDREKEQMFSMGEKKVLEKMLPIVDNFERGLASTEKTPENEAVLDGMEKIYRQLVKQMEDLGVKPIEALGKEFDPAFHNAVMQVESEDQESGTVAQELQKGYMYRDTVLRHSMVGVVS